jgi:hypothetical protein
MDAQSEAVGELREMADPTPEQRAEYLVLKLEQFIREGRSEKGMSFKTWQSLARSELTNAFAENEKRLAKSRQDQTARRLILVGTSTAVTVGFWGMAVSIDHHYGILAAWIAACAALVVGLIAAEITARRMISRYRTEARLRRFERIEDFDDQLKKLEKKLWLKLKREKERAEQLEAS